MVSGSKLMLKSKQFTDPLIVEQTLKRFQVHGIEDARVIVEEHSTRLEYLQAYSKVDIALDPFPFPGGTTSVEGLWMGVPVLTLKGSCFIGHNGETIAHNSRQSDWVAKDESEYLLKAQSFAADIDSLVEIRASLRVQIQNSPLLNGPRFTRHFEDAMIGMLNEGSTSASISGKLP